MKKWINKIIFYSLLFVYVYSIVFDFFPLSTKIILEVFGLLLCIKYLASNRWKLKSEYKLILSYILLLAIWDIVISLLNGQREFHIIKSMFAVVFSIFGSELLYKYYKRTSFCNVDFYYILVIVIFIESSLAILMKAFPELYNFIDSIIVFDLGDESRDDIFTVARLSGIGNAIYFGVLPSCCLGVMSSVYVISQTKSSLVRFYIMIMWIVISIASFMTARTSILLVGMSVLYFLYCQKEAGLKRSISIFFLFITLIFVAYLVTMNNVDQELQKWAFSFLIDRDSDDGSVETVMHWWLNTSVSPGTLFWGDAQYIDPKGGFYRHVDVGVFREIFYGGLLFLLMNLYIHWRILRMCLKYNSDKFYKLFLASIMIGYIGILSKGDASMLTFFILFLVFQTRGIFEPCFNNKNIITQ